MLWLLVAFSFCISRRLTAANETTNEQTKHITNATPRVLVTESFII